MSDEKRLAAMKPANGADAGKPTSTHGVIRQAARRLQLGSGILLWIYISIHLVNHALGIWSIDIAERGLTLAIGLWQSLPGTILLYGAAGLHFALAIRTIYSRRHWALPPAEWLRLWAGLSLPMLLIRHVVGTRVATSFYGFDPSYERVIVSLLTSGTQGLQIALLAPGWVHGSLGLWFHLRRYALVRRAKFVLLAVLVVLPLLSAAGFVHMARDRAGKSRRTGARRGAGRAPRRARHMATFSRHRLSVADWGCLRSRPAAKRVLQSRFARRAQRATVIGD
ncbi:hypothetical protein [Burkholderia ubonensis]|uniref:hypothetical protein n=1 Tax=Burkholderia ubonensis TaxID=101571 RepID=UPI002FC83EF1